MERDQLQAFNERLSQWVSGQGFWFQLRYSLGVGSFSSATFNILFRGFILALVLALIGGICLFKRVDITDYRKVVAADIGRQINGDSQVGGFKRNGGKLAIRVLRSKGGPNAFFSSLVASEIRCDMGLLDGLVGVWEPGPITAGKLEIDLRAGAEDDAAAAHQAASFLKTFPKFNATSLAVADTNITWGFSDRNSGKIENSRMNAQRTPDGWRLQFQGGHFSQNWLHQAEISKLTVLANADGIKVEEGELVVPMEDSSTGRISFHDVLIKGGSRPVVSGVLAFNHVSLSAMLDPHFEGMVEGAVSGELKLSGSTYSSEGIGFAGQVNLANDDRVLLRDRFPLLSALSAFNSYRRIELVRGTFFIKTSDGILDVRDVNLETKEKGKPEDAVKLQGRMRVRPLTPSEIQVAMGKQYVADSGAVFGTDAKKDDKKNAPDQSPAGTGAADKFDPGYFAHTNPDELVAQTQQLQTKVAETISHTLHYEGAFQFTLPGDLFARSVSLQKSYPVDPETGKLILEVPIEGVLEDLTKSQADEIRSKSRAD